MDTLTKIFFNFESSTKSWYGPDANGVGLDEDDCTYLRCIYWWWLHCLSDSCSTVLRPHKLIINDKCKINVNLIEKCFMFKTILLMTQAAWWAATVDSGHSWQQCYYCPLMTWHRSRDTGVSGLSVIVTVHRTQELYTTLEWRTWVWTYICTNTSFHQNAI